MEKIENLQTNVKMKFKEKIGYGIGEVALNFLVGGISNYLFFFYTDVFGIGAGAVGIILLLSRIWDAVNDPLMGMIADRTNSKHGKYRPYILWGAIPVALFTVLAFMAIDVSYTWKIVWAAVTFNLWGMAFTFIAVPYNALMANLTTDSQERSSLGSIKSIFAAIGAMLVVVLAKPMTEALGQNLQEGYIYTYSIFAVLAVAIFLLCFFNTKEKAIPQKKEKIKLKIQFKAVWSNRPLISLILFFIFFQVAFSMFRSVEMYYFKYVLDRSELYTIAVLAGSLCAAVGMVFTPAIVKLMDKKYAALSGGVVGCLFFLLMYFIPNNITISFVGIMGSYLFMSVPFALFIGMLPDTVEYGQWKSGVRAAGLIISAWTATQKAGMAIAAWLIGVVLDSAGFIANQAQPQVVLNSMLALRTIIPVALVIIGMLLFLPYNLNRNLHKKILGELEEAGE